LVIEGDLLEEALVSSSEAACSLRSLGQRLAGRGNLHGGARPPVRRPLRKGLGHLVNRRAMLRESHQTTASTAASTAAPIAITGVAAQTARADAEHLAFRKS